jgi:hypothetical protein
MIRRGILEFLREAPGSVILSAPAADAPSHVIRSLSQGCADGISPINAFLDINFYITAAENNCQSVFCIEFLFFLFCLSFSKIIDDFPSNAVCLLSFVFSRWTDAVRANIVPLSSPRGKGVPRQTPLSIPCHLDHPYFLSNIW